MKRTFGYAFFALTVAAAAIAGCGDDGSTVDFGQKDLSSPGPRDLSAGADMAGADEGMPADLASGPDLTAVDLTPQPDLVPPTPSGQIGNVRIAADTANPDGGALAIDVFDVYVTYLRTDLVGFYVQAEKLGPAVFVAIDPATLSPAPVVGDKVSFTVTGVAKVSTLRMVTAISNWQRTAQGFDVSTLVQDLSTAADLVTNIDNYDSELMTLKGTFSGPFGSSGTGFMQAQIDTAAVTANNKLVARIASTIVTTDDLAQGCEVTIGATPLGRFGSTMTTVQPSAYQASELTVNSCPAPRVVSAAPSNATTLVVTFDRNIDAVSVNTDGSQFTFNNGLTATSATATTVRTITVGTTSQAAGTTYTVTVNNSVVDTYAKGIDPGYNTATFLGYTPPAGVILNEVNPNISGGADLVELLVTSAGSLSGIKLLTSTTTAGATTTLATLPDLVAQKDDLIVVHLKPPAGVTITTETTTKSQCTDNACYSGAWDVLGNTTTDLSFSNRVLSLKSALGATIDAVPFVNTNVTTPPAAYPSDVQAIQTAGLWLPADCTGSPCTYTSTPTVSQISASWTTTNATNSAQRTVGANTKTLADWTVKTQTFGASN